jgi:stage II sporulation protein D
MFLILAQSKPESPWIRVGLGDPESYPQFSAKGTLQFFEGSRLRRELQVKGPFTLIPRFEGKSMVVYLQDEDYYKTKIGVFQSLEITMASSDQGIGFGVHRYRGRLRLHPEAGKVQVVNVLPLETYLRGVVAAEMGPVVYPQLEALKAQAIAARTYAVKNLNRFHKKGYDICDTPACQVYKGMAVEHPLSDQAIQETASVVLTYQGALIDALYTSTCGGQTDRAAVAFPSRGEAYLQSQRSRVDQMTSWPLEFSWKVDSWPDQASLMLFLRGVYSNRALEDESQQWDSARQWLQTHTKGMLVLPAQPLAQWGDWLEWLIQTPWVEEGNRVLFRGESRRTFEVFGEDSAQAQLVHLDVIPFHWIGRPRNSPLSREQLSELFLHLIEKIQPQPTAERFFVQSISDQEVFLTNSKHERTLALKDAGRALGRVEDRLFLPKSEDWMPWDLVFIYGNQRVVWEPNNRTLTTDGTSPYAFWQETKSKDELLTRLRRYIPNIGRIKELNVRSRGDSGRIQELEVHSDQGEMVLKGLQVRWGLGVRENLFTFLPVVDQQEIVSVHFFGRGWGHGVGMSQVGAFGLALEGKTAEEILLLYYAGVTLSRLDELKRP